MIAPVFFWPIAFFQSNPCGLKTASFTEKHPPRHNIFWIIPWERRTQSFLPEKNDGNKKTIGKP